MSNTQYAGIMLLIATIAILAFSLNVKVKVKEDPVWTQIKAIKTQCEKKYRVKCGAVIIPETVNLNQCIKHITYRREI